MKKTKVHKVIFMRGITTKCGLQVWDARQTWRGVPIEDRCKNCLRAEGKR